MLNNLKSDLYRMFHSRSLYITLIVGIIVYGLLLSSSGIRIGSMFADFSRETNSFVDYLYYLPKSPVFMVLVLVFISIFHNDEYASGFMKNIMPLMNHKWMLIVERYVFNIIFIVIILTVLIIASTIIQCFVPMEHTATLPIANFMVYTFVQIFFTATLASVVMMLNHLTRSRVLIIIFSVIYGASIVYMLETMIAELVFHNLDILKYMMLQISGTLSYDVSWNTYKFPLCIALIFTIVYNVISFIAIRKRDM